MSWMSTPPQPVAISPTRSLGGLTFDVVIEEQHEDALVITEHPVEQGAAVSDHAYKRAATVVLRAGRTDAGGGEARALYDKLLALQASAEPFDIVTGRRLYRNMLIESLSTTTDAATENALIITAECREVIIVRTAVTTVPPRSRHANARRTGGIGDTGQKQAQPQRRSALSAAFGSGGDSRPGGPA